MSAFDPKRTLTSVAIALRCTLVSYGATMLTLYDFGNSVCCQKVRITMRAKGLTWEPVKVDLFKAEQYDPKYLKLNPKGIVPTLVHDGKPIIESTLICEYLDDTFPQPRLIPSDPWQRTRMRLWSKMVDEGLFEGVTELSFSAMFRERMRNMPEWDCGLRAGIQAIGGRAR